MFSLSVELGLSSKHVDVRSAYQNSLLKEDLFMKQPEMFEEKPGETRVVKLRRSIYGLHQAVRDWHELLDRVMRALGLTPAINDPCLYIHFEKKVYVAVYVDDFGMWGKKEDLNTLAKKLSSYFDVRDLGEISDFFVHVLLRGAMVVFTWINGGTPLKS